ncbi:MAG: RNA chaperone Hfq [Oscillospiraceae bacterium]|jgi:host factor-I protein|nr:RNA chaperone Hfq [Oscillospiraceae bacterium]
MQENELNSQINLSGNVSISLQEHFLNSLRQSKASATVFLMNGFQMRGRILAFDRYTVIMEADGKQQLIFKHAISTVVPTNSFNWDLSKIA